MLDLNVLQKEIWVVYLHDSSMCTTNSLQWHDITSTTMYNNYEFLEFVLDPYHIIDAHVS